MEMLSQIDTHLEATVLRKQGEVWDAVIDAVAATCERLFFRAKWALASPVSVDDVLADLAYGRE